MPSIACRRPAAKGSTSSSNSRTSLSSTSSTSAVTARTCLKAAIGAGSIEPRGNLATKYRHRVLGLLSLLLVITYLDRVCISVAGPRMQEALNIGPLGWSWVTGIFTLAYAVFELPSGAMGDRIGPRKVLTRIVLWWSVFTSLTGTATSYLQLLTCRFLFGAGEAGAYPNTSGAIARWFPAAERGRAQGAIWMASRLGGALSPLIVVPIQARYGWRTS